MVLNRVESVKKREEAGIVNVEITDGMLKKLPDSVIHPVNQSDGCFEPHTSRDRNRPRTPRINIWRR